MGQIADRLASRIRLEREFQAHNGVQAGKVPDRHVGDAAPLGATHLSYGKRGGLANLGKTQASIGSRFTKLVSGEAHEFVAASRPNIDLPRLRRHRASIGDRAYVAVIRGEAPSVRG